VRGIVGWAKLGCSGIVEVVQNLLVLGCPEESARSRYVLGADGFTIPAGAFRVHTIEQLLVCLASPFKTGVQCIFVHLVVVVNKLLALRDGVVVI